MQPVLQWLMSDLQKQVKAKGAGTSGRKQGYYYYKRCLESRRTRIRKMTCCLLPRWGLRLLPYVREVRLSVVERACTC